MEPIIARFLTRNDQLAANYLTWSQLVDSVEYPATVEHKNDCEAFTPQISSRKTNNFIRQYSLNPMSAGWLDIDTDNLTLKNIVDKLKATGLTKFAVYTSSMSQRTYKTGEIINGVRTGNMIEIKNGARWRVVFPFSRALSIDDWQQLQEAVNSIFTGDPCNTRFHQVFYAPSIIPTNEINGILHWESHIENGDILNVDNLPVELAKRFYAASQVVGPDSAHKASSAAINDQDAVLQGLIAKDLYINPSTIPGKHYIHCPWEHLHTGTTGPKDAVLYQEGCENQAAGFKCLHTDHGAEGEKTLKDLVTWLGQDYSTAELNMLPNPAISSGAAFPDPNTVVQGTYQESEFKNGVVSIRRANANLALAGYQKEELIRKIIAPGVTATLAGESGSLKSYLILDIAMAGAYLDSWHGLTFPMGNFSSLFVLGEGKADMLDRERVWRQDKNPVENGQEVYIYPYAMNFTDFTPDGAVRGGLYNTLKANPNIKMVFVDTLNQSTTESENDNTAMGQMIRQANVIAEELGIAIIFIHHKGKGVGSNKGHRGADAIFANPNNFYDVSHQMKAIKKEDGSTEEIPTGRIEFMATKLKGRELTDKPMVFKSRKVTIKNYEYFGTGEQVVNMVLDPVCNLENIVNRKKDTAASAKRGTYPHIKQMPLIKSLVRIFAENPTTLGIHEPDLAKMINEDRIKLGKGELKNNKIHLSLGNLKDQGVLDIQHNDTDFHPGRYDFYYSLNHKAQDSIDYYNQLKGV